jgi:hypothetical protein
MNMNFIRAAMAIAALSVSNFAAATVYSNSAGSPIEYWGNPNGTEVYGEVFNTTGGELTNWSFTTTAGNAGNYEFAIADWNGSEATSIVYTTGVTSFAGGAENLDFNGINALLASGSYIAYVNVVGVADAATDVVFAGSSSNGGLGGQFEFSNNNPQTPGWSTWSNPDMEFSATINHPVPEPASIALFGAALAAFAFARRRKA